MSGRGDPSNPFYFTQVVGNLDGTMDLPEGVSIFETEEEALAYMEHDNKTFNLTTYVFLCKPIFRVKRRKMRIEKLS